MHIIEYVCTVGTVRFLSVVLVFFFFFFYSVIETKYSVQTSAYGLPVFRSVGPTINKIIDLNSKSLKVTWESE